MARELDRAGGGEEHEPSTCYAPAMSFLLRAGGIFLLAAASAALSGCGDDDGPSAGMDAGVDSGARDGGAP